MISLYRMLKTAAVPFVVGGAIATVGCSSNAPPKGANPEEKPNADPQSGADAEQAKKILAAAQKSLPASLPRPTTVTDSANFAWQQFLSLNRKAALPDGRAITRGTADPSGALGQSTELLVWQTYAHKTELRPNGPLTTPWDSLGVPTYQNAFTKPLSRGTPDARLDLWNNLDEDSEIASCQLFGQYNSQPGAQRQKSLVLFEAKVNRDEYEFIRINYGADQHIGNAGPKGNPTECNYVVPAHGRLCAAELRARNNIKNGNYNNTAQCECPLDEALCLPCSSATTDGTVEVKAAWRKLLPSEDASQYYTSTALYYQYEYDPASKSYQYRYYNDTFALIGLHIIRKLQNYPDFVFTSFEHVGEAGADDEYVTLDGDGAETSPPTRATRQSSNPNTNRNQNHAIPGEIQNVNLRMRHLLQSFDSIWRNYQLIGVQAGVTDCKISGSPPPVSDGPSQAGLACIQAQNQDVGRCLQMDPNYYMANLFVETDPFLNNFSGPGFGGNTFGNCENTLYNKTKHNMGGCKGCHGVAQTAFGSDFSFLLDFGQGKPGVEPDTLRPPSADIADMRVFSSAASATPVPGSDQQCRTVNDGCLDFCRHQCETTDCIAYNVHAGGCESFPRSVPMSTLTLKPAPGYQTFLSPGTTRPGATPKDGVPQKVGFPAAYLQRSKRNPE